jgi:hypothetical protein
MNSEIILSLDVSREPASCLLVAVDGDRLRALKDLSIDTEGLFNPALWEYIPPPPTSSEEQAADAAAAPSLEEKQAELDAKFKERCQQLRTVLKSLPAEWTSSALVFQSKESLTLTVNLPFADSKQVERVIGLEVQDHLPFDISQFVIAKGDGRPGKQGGFDVPTAIVPRKHVNHLMRVCNELEIDPMLVTTPLGSLSNLFSIAPELKRGTAALVLSSAEHLCLSVIDGDVVVSERSAPLKEVGADPYNSLVELRHALAASEQQIGKRVERIYLLGDGIDSAIAQGVFQRDVVSVSAGELVVDAPARTIAAALAVPGANELSPAPARVNFRQGEFAYGIPTKELWRGFVALAPYGAVVLILLAFSFAVSYLTTAYQIGVKRAALHEQIKSVIPDIVLSGSREDYTVESNNLKIESDLKNLGSFSRISPLDALAEISNDLPMSAGIVAINRIFIRESKVTVEGRLGSYSARDKLEKAFKKRRTMYCKVDEIDTTAPNAGTGGTIGFVMNATLCE